jgi:hypothetical protein
LKDESEKHDTLAYPAERSQGPTGPETSKAKIYLGMEPVLHKLFRSIFVEIPDEWDVNLLAGSTGSAFINGPF